jgi:hypothetical protein
MRSMSQNKALVRTREPAGQDCRQNSLAGNQDSRQNNTYSEDTHNRLDKTVRKMCRVH